MPTSRSPLLAVNRDLTPPKPQPKTTPEVQRKQTAAAHWASLHAKIDLNGDGVVSWIELTKQLAAGVGEIAAEVAAKDFMNKMDIDKDGGITSEEWLSVCSATHETCIDQLTALSKKLGVSDELRQAAQEAALKGDDASIKEAFTRLWEFCDANKDGKVVLAELKDCLSSGWSKTVAEDYASQLMASTDENHDGEISLEEWQSFFNKVWHDEGPPSEQIDQTMEYLLFGRESLTH